MNDGSNAQRRPAPEGFGVPEKVEGAWATRRRFAASLRRLANLALTRDASENAFEDAATQVESLISRLSDAPRQTLQGSYRGQAHRPVEWADRSSLVGESHPFAPPLRLWMEGETAVAEATYEAIHEGAPGLLHGGYVATAMDHIAGVVVADRGKIVLTGKLEVRYKKPTRLHRPIRYEARFIEQRRRLIRVDTKALDAGELTAEARVSFYELSQEELNQLIDQGESHV